MGNLDPDEFLGSTGSGETFLDDISGLIPEHITTRKELYEAEFVNITHATQFYLSSPARLKKFNLTREKLFELHKNMFNKVWLWAGKKRTTNKNIGVLAYKIDEEVQKLIDDYDFWIKNNMDILEIIARAHHRLVWIHPFDGGNGRWCRLLTNILLYKKTKMLLLWPEDELQLKNKSSFRSRYLKALRNADTGKLDELIKIHKYLIKK